MEILTTYLNIYLKKCNGIHYFIDIIVSEKQYRGADLNPPFCF